MRSDWESRVDVPSLEGEANPQDWLNAAYIAHDSKVRKTSIGPNPVRNLGVNWAPCRLELPLSEFMRIWKGSDRENGFTLILQRIRAGPPFSSIENAQIMLIRKGGRWSSLGLAWILRIPGLTLCNLGMLRRLDD